MAILITGEPGVGKTTLIRRVREALACPVFGFETAKEPRLATEEGTPVYIHEIGTERHYTQENLVGIVEAGQRLLFPDAFEHFAPVLQKPIPEGSLIVLDELGFLETYSPTFCSAVLALLDSPFPIIAAVKPKSSPFLDAVRSHKNSLLFPICPENRDELFFRVKEVLAAKTSDCP